MLSSRKDIHSQEVDVLVLGAGLAGLRAARAALEARPGLRLAVVSAAQGPTGSSFANIHDMLGMQVCFSDTDKERFTDDVLALAGQGRVDRALVEAMAEESPAVLRDLAGLGVSFKRDADGSITLFPGCFSHGRGQAVVFTGLGDAHRRFHGRVADLGGEFLTGWMARRVLVRDGTAVGALLAPAAPGGELLAVRAGAVVMALGGPAPLFDLNQAGRANPGWSYGLLRRAGAALANEGFLQYMWADARTRRFWPIHSLREPGSMVRGRHGEDIPLPEEVLAKARTRDTHAPFGYGLDDSALDLFLAAHLDRDGAVEAYSPRRGWERVAPMAHAGNGGATIDAMGRTSVPGLYACGECATGMHGANRVGGAMVLATQVFGARAGRAAALECGAAPREPSSPDLSPTPDADSRARLAIRRLRKELRRRAVLGGRPGLRALGLELRHDAPRARSWQEDLTLSSASAIVDHLCSLQTAQAGPYNNAAGPGVSF